MRSEITHNEATSTVRDSRCHVLFLVDRLQSIAGGAEGAIEKLCRFLPADRFRCSVATFWAKPNIGDDFGCPVQVYPLDRIYGWNALKYGVKLGLFLRRERVDIVHTFFPASDLWGSMVATLSRCPVLISSRRDMGILRMRKHRLPYMVANRLFDQVQAVSDRVREFCIREEGIAPEKVVTVPNGVDLATIDAARPADRIPTLGLSDTTPLVMTVANLRSVKGIDVLLRAIAIVRRDVPDAVFAVIGESIETGYKEQLLSLVHELGIANNIEFLGARKDVFSLLKMADVFCLPSRSEGLSNALLEAMACGLPCVATEVGGNPQVVAEGKSGFLVPSEQPQLLAQKLVMLVKDKELRDRMGRTSRLIVQERYTVQHMVDRLAKFYDQLLEKNRTAVARPRQGGVSKVAETVQH
jgi:glycosyltransferase involved in cell wall biosynthesis